MKPIGVQGYIPYKGIPKIDLAEWNYRKNLCEKIEIFKFDTGTFGNCRQIKLKYEPDRIIFGGTFHIKGVPKLTKSKTNAHKKLSEKIEIF